jgi:hypothetical protein
MTLVSPSILTFHDSVELFLHLACEETRKNIKKDMPFMDYWEVLKELPNGTSLGYKAAVQRLNTLRVNLKHYGIRPNEAEVESARVSTISFFEDSTPIIFNVDFEKISMSDLVTFTPGRERLNRSTILIEQNKFGEALIEISIAFDMILGDYEGRKKSRFGQSHFNFDRPIFASQDMFEDIKRFVDESVGPLKKAMRIISLGLDYRQYVRFRQLAPEVDRFLGDESDYISTEPPANRTKEDCQFCYDFVIDSAIRLQDFDFDVRRA